MDTGIFRGSLWGPRTRFGILGCFSLTGFIRESISLERGGDSTSFQILFEIFLVFFFIIFTLSSVCFTQTDNTDFISTNCIYHHIKLFTNNSNCYPFYFAIVMTIINRFKCSIPFEIHRFCKINPVTFKINQTLIFVPFILHGMKLYKKYMNVNQIVYTIW